MKSKLGLIILALILLITPLSACAQQSEEAPDVEAPEGEEAAAEGEEEAAGEEAIRIAFFVPWTEDIWYVAAIEGAKIRAEEMGFELEVFDAGYDVATQVQQWDTAMASNPDAMIFAGVDPLAMVPSVEAAHEKGIITVAYDRPLWETEALDALMIVDTVGIGTTGAEQTVEYLTEKYGEPKGKVIRVMGDLADTWVTDISSGWNPVMEQYPDIQVIEATSGAWEPELAAANVEQLLLTNDDVDTIFVDSDFLSSGIVSYLEREGYPVMGEEGHIYFMGVGGMPQGLDYLREGWYDELLINPIVDLTDVAVEVAFALANGDELPTEWVREGSFWSPATIYPSPEYGVAPFASEEKPYAGPVLNMENLLIDASMADDPALWGNMDSGEAEAEEEPAEEEEEAEAEPIRIAFFVPWTEDIWYVAAIEGAKIRAEEMGFELEVFDAGYDVATQVQQWDTAMASNPDAMIFAGVDPLAMVPSVEAAHEKGIITVAYDRPLWETEALDALMIVDTVGIGTTGAEQTVEYLTEKYGEPKGKVIRVMGDLADTWVTDISSGWNPVMEQYPDIQVIEATSGAWEPELAAANVEQLLLTNDDVDAIFVDSDFLSSGIVSYLEREGYPVMGEEGHIYFMGVGGMPQGLDYLREGWYDELLINPIVDLTDVAVEVAFALANGDELPTEWVREGSFWSPATIYPSPEYGVAPFASEEKPYAGPVLNMENLLIDASMADDPALWGNME